jgi:hypothetical protein
MSFGRINIDFDCFGAGVCCAFARFDKLNTNTIYIYVVHFVYNLLGNCDS